METGAQRETAEMKNKKMKNWLWLQLGPFGELLSNYSYSRASAGELILDHSYRRALSRNLKCNNYCANDTMTVCSDYLKRISKACGMKGAKYIRCPVCVWSKRIGNVAKGYVD